VIGGSRVLCVYDYIVVLVGQEAEHVFMEIEVDVGFIALPEHRDELRSSDDVDGGVDTGRRDDPILTCELVDHVLPDVKELS
jgi:hypothetical protein